MEPTELARMDLREVKAREDRTEAPADKGQAAVLEALLAVMQALAAKELELEVLQPKGRACQTGTSAQWERT